MIISLGYRRFEACEASILHLGVEMTDIGVDFLFRHSNWRRLELPIHSLLIIVLLNEVLFSLALLLLVFVLLIVADGALQRSLLSRIVPNLVHHYWISRRLDKISKFLCVIYGGELHSSLVNVGSCCSIVVAEVVDTLLIIIFHTFCY